MADKVLNIEIGDRLSKVCRTVKRGKGIQLESSFIFRTPDGAVTDGLINDTKALAEVLRAELARRGLATTKEVIFSLASGRIATREVTLPPVKDNRVQALVETNAADYFPVDMSGYKVAYTILERLGGETPGLRVQVMAAPMSLTESYVALADACGLKIQYIDYSGNSQYQALRMLQSKGTVMYVNVSTSSTYCTFLTNGVLMLQRSFAFGGNDLVSAYLSATGRENEAYLDALGELSRSGAEPVSQDEAADMLERLVSSIVRSVNFFSSMRTAQSVGVEQIILIGACAHLAHLRDLVAENSGIRTIYLDEFPGITKQDEDSTEISSYIACIGSAVAPVDFLPVGYKNRNRLGGKRVKKKSSSLSGGVVICAVCVVGSLLLCTIAALGYLSEQRKLQSMQSRINELAPAQLIYDTYVEYSDTVKGLQVIKDAAVDHNAQLESFFEELERKMPASIVILTASCTNEGVTMEVTVPSLNEAAVAVNQLRSFASIQVVSVGEVTEQADESGVVRARFEVSCLYPVPEPKEEQAPQAGQQKAGDAAGAETEDAK